MKTRLKDYKTIKNKQKKPLETFSLLRWYKDTANVFKVAENGGKWAKFGFLVM